MSRSQLRRATRAALLLAVLFPTAGCDLIAANTRAQAQDEWTRRYEIGATGTLEIENTNGAIDVERGTGTAVVVHAERKARSSSEQAAKELLGRIEIVERPGSGSISLKTNSPALSGIFGGQTEVRYRVQVPPGTRVKAHTTNGHVDVSGVDGDIDAGTTNGHIKGRALSGAIEAETTNGGIDMDVASVASRGVQLETTNGSISLRVPTSARASISASTVNGGINASALELETTEKGRRKLVARLNGGGAKIQLETTNGGITIGAARGAEAEVER